MVENNPTLSDLQKTLDEAVSYLRSHVAAPTLEELSVGIVCGSGLGGLASQITEETRISYADIPGFMQSSVAGHSSSLVFGKLGGKTVVAMLGRFHAYEGHHISQVVLPIRVMAMLGIQNIIVTNAAGSLNPDITAGTIVSIHDHVALPAMTGTHPLLGPLFSVMSPKSSLGPDHIPPRFMPVSALYDFRLRQLTFEAARKIGLAESALAEGVYAWVIGPTYESPAEVKFLRAAGADVVRQLITA